MVMSAVALSGQAASGGISIRLEHVGPQDAAWPPLLFSAAAPTTGHAPAERPAVVHIAVAAAQLVKMCQVLAAAGPAPDPALTGTFAVTAVGCDGRLPSLLGPQAFLAIAELASAGRPLAAEKGLDTLQRVVRIVEAARQRPRR